eukprot:PhM_4_TR10568/c0_g1_i1/m.2660/K11108/RCL1; RNA 3'-terminal phosphate cyclase-like protein
MSGGAASETSSSFLKYEGPRFLRYQVAMSVLSSKPIEVSTGRPLKDFEVNLLRLVDRITTGTKLDVSPDATAFRLTPGVIAGGAISHPCPGSRGLGYWLEFLALLLAFGKTPSEVTLHGVTNHASDMGVDVFRTVTVPLVRKFGVECALRVVRRGCPPSTDGTVVFSMGNVRTLNAVEIVDRGKIKRVRGIAYGAHVSTDILNRAATASKGVLMKLIPDVYVVTDLASEKDAGKSPGYGICLVTESTTRNAVCAQELEGAAGGVPEDLGVQCACMLLDQVRHGGCVDQPQQALCSVLMALSPDVISRVRFGAVLLESTEYVVRVLLREHFGVGFVFKEEANPYDADMPGSLIATCIGCKLVNSSKRSA